MIFKNCKSEDKISIRIGVTDAPNLKDKLKELNKLSNNKILDHTDEDYKYYEYAKDLEDIADHDSNDNQKDTSFIALSKCFFDGLNTQTTSLIESFYDLFNNNNNDNDNELFEKLEEAILQKCEEKFGNITDITDSLIVPKSPTKKLSNGYIIFIKVKKNKIETFQETLSNCNDRPLLLSIEDKESVYNFYSEKLDNFKNLLNCIRSLGNSLKITITGSDNNKYKIYKIENNPGASIARCTENSKNYKDSQTFVRYISHNQNIAARLLYGKLEGGGKKNGTEWGFIDTNKEQIKNKLGGVNKYEKKKFKRVG